jgi:uncharacterized membrane protein
MDGGRVGRSGTALALVGALLITGVVLIQGVLLKRECAGGDWQDGRQYRHFCYSDIVPLYGTERLTGGRLPYLDACPTTDGQCDEYPLLTMYFMRVAAWLGQGFAAFFYWNALLLGLLAMGTAWLLFRMVGWRVLYFSLAPTLLIYGFVNWDLLAVFLATAATYLYLRSREAWAGGLLGLGAAAKLYPGLLVVPFGLDRARQRRFGEGLLLAVWAVVTWAAVNMPFAFLASTPWSTFFRFNARRPPDWDSLWFVVCQRLEGGTGCPWSPTMVNALALVLLVLVAVAVWYARSARRPDFPAWTFAFPLLVIFLLTSKVYSPQFSLWLLPWFALALPSPGLFIAFELADVAVFLTRFSWFGRLNGLGGAPIGAFEIAVVVRAVVLLVCVVAWIRRAEDLPEKELASGRTLGPVAQRA